MATASFWNMRSSLIMPKCVNPLTTTLSTTTLSGKESANACDVRTVPSPSPQMYFGS